MAVVGVLFWGLMFGLCSRVLLYFQSVEVIGDLLAHHLLAMVLLTFFSLGCIFGTPLYALVYALPFFKQSHSPFRWVFPLTLCVAVLAGFGI